MPGVHGPQKVPDALELELHMVVSHLVGAGTEPEFSAQAVSALNCWPILLLLSIFTEYVGLGKKVAHSSC